MISPLLAELEALEKKATQEPWGQDVNVWLGSRIQSKHGRFLATGLTHADTALIVAMRNNLTKLIAALRFEMETSDILARIYDREWVNNRRAELSRILEGKG